MQGSVDTVGNAIGTLKDVASDAVNGVIGFFSDLANSGKQSINDM